MQSELNEDVFSSPTRQEIELYINRLRNNKSPELDEIQSEILKALNEATIFNIHNLMEKI